LLGTNN